MNTEQLTIGAINPGYGGLPIGVAAAAVAAMLSQLKPGAVIEDTVTSLQDPHTGTRRLVITYREPIEGRAK